jgi:general stress protein 26
MARNDNRAPQRFAGELLGETRIVGVTTVTTGGQLHSRPMLLCHGPDHSLWFFSHRDDRATHDIQIDEHVCVTSVHSDATDADEGVRFVSIAGRARLRADPELAKRLWHPALEAWFPRGLAEPGLQLINILVDQVEYWQNGVHHFVAPEMCDSEEDERTRFEERAHRRNPEPDEIRVLMAADEPPD